MTRELDDYFAAAEERRQAGFRAPMACRVLPPIDVLYRRASKIESKTEHAVFRDLSLIAHKSLLAAALQIAQRQPEDAAGVTRRAIEAAKVYLAIKIKPANLQHWMSFRERDERWRIRTSGRKPKILRIKLSGLKDHPLAEDLDRWMGIISDEAVHFTPEFFGTLDWEMQSQSDGTYRRFLHYFHRNHRHIDQSWLSLVAAHLSIIAAFDFCLDGALRQDDEGCRLWEAAKSAAREARRFYTREYSPIYLDDWIKTV